MRAPIYVVLVLLGCFAAAAIGWSFGTGSKSEPSQAKSVHSEPQRTNDANGAEKATLKGDYRSVAEGQVTLRAGRDLKAIFRSLGGQRTTKLGADLAALAVVGELEEDEVVDLLPDLLAEEPLPENLIAAALARWAQFEPEAALEWAEEKLDRPAFDLAGNEIVAAWATHAPRAAIAWLDDRRAVASGQAQHILDSNLHTILMVWSQHDPAAALEAVLDPEHSAQGKWYGLGQVASMDEHRDRMFGLVLGIEDEQLREKGLGAMIGGWAGDDPAGAADWLDDNGYEDSKTQWAVSQRYQRADPAANADWLLVRSTPETLERSLNTAIAYWARSDPEAAGKWVEESDVLTDGLANQVATGWINRDPDRAIGWAMRLQEEGARHLSIGNVLFQLEHGPRAAAGARREVDLENFTAATGMDVDELAKLSEAAGKQSRGRW